MRHRFWLIVLGSCLLPALPRITGIGWTLICAALLLVALIVAGLVYVPENRLAVVRFAGNYLDTLGPGTAWYWPIFEVVSYDARDNVTEWELNKVRTADGTPLTIAMRVIAHFDPRTIRRQAVASELTSYLPDLTFMQRIITKATEQIIRQTVAARLWREIGQNNGYAHLQASLEGALRPFLRDLGIVPAEVGGIIVSVIEMSDYSERSLDIWTALQHIMDAFHCTAEEAASILARLRFCEGGNRPATVVTMNALGIEPAIQEDTDEDQRRQATGLPDTL